MVQRLQGEAGEESDLMKRGTCLAEIWTIHRFCQAGQLTTLTQTTQDQIETLNMMTVLSARAEEAHSWTGYRSLQIGNTTTKMAVGTSEPIDSSNMQSKTFLKLIGEKAHHVVDSQETTHLNKGATHRRNENT